MEILQPKKTNNNGIITILFFLVITLFCILIAFLVLLNEPNTLLFATSTPVSSITFTSTKTDTRTPLPSKTLTATRTVVPPPTRRPTATIDILILTPPTALPTMPKVKEIPGYYNPNPTALCNDGTYSYSQTRKGTCSNHGGVYVWFR